MAKKTIDLSIVIPALREEKRISSTLKKLAQYLKKDKTFSQLSIEIIVVAADGGDDTVGVAKKHSKSFKAFTVLQPGKPVGKGRDVQVGMRAARGKVIVFMDADLATPLKYLNPTYKAISSGSDIAIGTRNLKKHHKSLLRRSLSNAGNLAYRIFGGVWVEDSQCGFKMFTDRAADTCFSRLTIMKWGFDMEVLSIAKVHKLKITTIRINDWEHMEGGNFDGKILKHAQDTLIDLGKIFHKRITGEYK